MSWESLWEDVHKSRVWGQYPGEDVIRFVKREFGAVPDRSQVRILEVGSGAGANLWFLAREGFCLHGIEGSETAVRRTNERLDRECPGWRDSGSVVRAGDFTQVDYPADYFDAVLDVAAVCSSGFEEATRVYADLARVTKPGGRIFARTFDRGSWGEGTGEPAGRGCWRVGEGPLAGLGALRFTSEDEVPALFAGWRVDRIERSRYTEDDRMHELRYLLVYGTKPAAAP